MTRSSRKKKKKSEKGWKSTRKAIGIYGLLIFKFRVSSRETQEKVCYSHK